MTPRINIGDFVASDRIILDLRVRDKAQLLRDLATRAEAVGGAGTTDTILAALQSREALGSTGLGKGFALPHARIEGLNQFVGLFARLARPIEYDAIDGVPVDLVFLLLMPSEAAGNGNVGALAAVSRRFRDSETVARLRNADAATALVALTGQ